MSSTNNAHHVRFIYHALYHRTVAGIQERIIGKRGRNVVSRVLHAKGDKETIAAWRLDLNRILHVFNVRSVDPVPPPLTPPFQTELAINNLIMVADLRRHLLESQEGTDRQHPSVKHLLSVNNRILTIP